jgi:predicted RNase H-like HicB family nuclease
VQREEDEKVRVAGQTLDEIVHNAKEAVTLYFEDEPSELEGYDRSPTIFSMMDLGEVHV